MQVNSGMQMMNGQPQQGYPPPPPNQPYSSAASQFVAPSQRPPALFQQIGQPPSSAGFAPTSDGGVMGMKPVPPMHNGVFQGENFPPPAASFSGPPVSAGLPSQPATSRLPPLASSTLPPFPPQPAVPPQPVHGLSAGPGGIPASSVGQHMHQMPSGGIAKVPGGGNISAVPGGNIALRPAGVVPPPRPPGSSAHQLPASLEGQVGAMSLTDANSPWQFHGGAAPSNTSSQPPLPLSQSVKATGPPNVSPAWGPTPPASSHRPAGPVPPQGPPSSSAPVMPQQMQYFGAQLTQPMPGPPGAYQLPAGITQPGVPPQNLPPALVSGLSRPDQPPASLNQLGAPPHSLPPQPPSVSGSFTSGQLPPAMNQPGAPPQNLPPVNPGPQTMMNMGFAPLPESHPPSGFASQGPPASAVMSGGSSQFSAQPPPPPSPHSQMNAGGMSTAYNYGSSQLPPRVMQPGHAPTSAPAAAGTPLAGPMSQLPPRKLDPDQMPSPIQVMEDDRRNRCGVFQTGQKGTVPPLVTTDFTVDDQGICSPRFLRSTMYNIPCTNDLLKQAHMPFALVLSPFSEIAHDEMPLPVVDLGQMGPVRCNRCKAYMCPFMVFIDGGRKFQCSFCTCTTEVPPEYFNHLDHTGRRVDCLDRPELCLGAYEFVATSDYCKDGKLPIAPAYIFMIDVSYQSVKSGLVNLLCTRIKTVLADLPRDPEDEESEIRVGFVTYSNVLHFYNLKGSLSQPQMLVVSDIQDVFVPLLDGFLVKLSESEAMIDMVLAQIAEAFSDSRQTEVVLGPVIQAGLDALKSSGRAGKLFIFHSSLPSLEAPGKLKSRDDRNLLGTEKEKTILCPQNNFYTKLGQECVAAGCSVDLFLFPNAYIDVASISEVPRLTGGKVHKYSYFQADLGGDMLIADLRTSVTRQAAFDAVVRVRTSTGIRAVDFYGNFYMSNTTDVELAAIGTDTALAVEIKHDDKLSEAEGAYVQAAVLYTSVGGRRRLRILNAAFNCCTQVADLFRSCELDTYVNFIAKQAIRDCFNSHSRQVRETLTAQCAQLLACYRKNCATPSSAGQLILPECMKLLPVYINCVIKSGILQSGDIATDDRSYEMHLASAMDVTSSNVYFYPRLISIHDVDPNDAGMPTPLRCSYERLQDNGVYLIDNGLVLLMWIGLGASSDWVRNVLGVASVAQVDIDKTRLQVLDNPLSLRVQSIISMIRTERRRHMKLVIVRQRDKLEPVFLHYLMEDRGSGGTSSYVDFLCHIHKEIRNLLS